jgi:hypothetical protein
VTYLNTIWLLEIGTMVSGNVELSLIARM